MVEYLADAVAVMQKGKIVEAGPVETLLLKPQHPYTQTLLAAVPRSFPGHHPSLLNPHS
ncbi:MAG: hypothetical protein ORN28_09990 [Rhodoferax sp.]|nr:hypothetical protein [Rhodoferax sp.]